MIFLINEKCSKKTKIKKVEKFEKLKFRII